MEAKKKDPRGGHPNCGAKRKKDRGEVKKTVPLQITPNFMCKLSGLKNLKEAESHCKAMCYEHLTKQYLKKFKEHLFFKK